jgi:SAM-dependent methyltransferase
MKSALVHVFGFPATLIHGDTLVLDRWLWLRRYLGEVPRASKQLLDVGCGSGAFTIGAARKGYKALGLSWDNRNQKVAAERARACGVSETKFDVLDVRYLDQRTDLVGQFDVVLCCENIEHIDDDRKLFLDMVKCLKKEGVLLLTTPNFHYIPMTRDDNGPFPSVEPGGHVRRGYTCEDLENLCNVASVKISKVEYCSGFLSQKITGVLRRVSSIHPLLGWAIILPFRWIPPIFDPAVSESLRWPSYSITLVATKI